MDWWWEQRRRVKIDGEQFLMCSLISTTSRWRTQIWKILHGNFLSCILETALLNSLSSRRLHTSLQIKSFVFNVIFKDPVEVQLTFPYYWSISSRIKATWSSWWNHRKRLVINETRWAVNVSVAVHVYSQFMIRNNNNNEAVMWVLSWKLKFGSNKRSLSDAFTCTTSHTLAQYRQLTWVTT